MPDFSSIQLSSLVAIKYSILSWSLGSRVIVVCCVISRPEIAICLPPCGHYHYILWRFRRLVPVSGYLNIEFIVAQHAPYYQRQLPRTNPTRGDHEVILALNAGWGRMHIKEWLL